MAITIDGTNGLSSDTTLVDVVGQVRASTGILFGSDTAAANALDDYEEGTWEPVLDPDSGTISSITYNADTGGKYVKIGQMVYYTGCIRWTALSLGTASGTANISGLPFVNAARSNGDNADSIGSARIPVWNGTASLHPTILSMRTNSSQLYMSAQTNSSTSTVIQMSNLGSACMVQFTIVVWTT